MAKRNSQPPEVKTFSLDEFFAKSYMVPAYQRNYSWGGQEVRQLVVDLYEFFQDSKSPYYLLGDVIVVEGRSPDYDLEIIDGQQRITTLMIIFSVLYRRLKSLSWDEDELFEIKSLIYKKKKMQVLMSGKGSEALFHYLNGGELKELKKETPTQKAVFGGIEEINTVLDELFGENKKAGSLHDFFETILENVYFSRLRLEDSEAAFDFFERVNDRGRPLSKTDLLKNRLLQKIKSDTDFENASETWAGAEKRLMPFGRAGSMQYLMKLMAQAESGAKIKDSELFNAWKSKAKDDKSCQQVIDLIDSGSKSLSLLLDDKTPHGDDAVFAQGTNFMGFTQNHGIKLAGAKLNRESYDELAQRLEARALLSLFGLERSQTYEQLAVRWSKRVHDLPVNANVKDVVEAVDVDEESLRSLLTRAKQGIAELRYGSTPGQTKRIRLFLAIVNFELNSKYPIHHLSISSLLTTSKKLRGQIHHGYDIEHISAASKSAYLGDVADSIGNLTLFYSKDNRSEGDSDAELKAESYSNSILFATNGLTENAQQDPSAEKVVSKLRTATVDDGHWGVLQIAERQDLYTSVFENFMRNQLKASS
jgi:hypothetical protein